eukprot:SAG31_NODE_8159_length_1507_cov_0.797585_3_plen_276_part_00
MHGEVAKLGKAEQYYREVGQIPRLLQRLQTFHFKLVFPEKQLELSTGINTLLGAATQVMTSALFKKLLDVVLMIGNFMNNGSFRGNAMGVKITFLTEIKSTKQSGSRNTLMHYISEYLNNNAAELAVDGRPVAQFDKDLDQVAAAVRVDADQTEADLNSLKYNLKETAEEMKKWQNLKTKCPEDGVKDAYGEVMTSFIADAEKQVADMDTNMQSMKVQLEELVRHFGEDPKKMKPRDLLAIVKDFTEDYVKAGADIEAEAAKQAKRERRAERKVI